MALIMLAELLTVESEADQLRLCLLPSMTGLRALITGGAVKEGRGHHQREDEGRR